MGIEALHSIQRTLRTPNGQGLTLALFGVCSLLILLVLAQVYVSQARRRRRLQERWRSFTEGMMRHGLSAPQRALMGEMARRDSPEDPALLLQSLEAFERGVHHHLKPLLAQKSPAAGQEAAALVSGLRDVLGFARARGREYFSTRELQKGQTVELYAAGRADTPICSARVGPPREDYLELAELRYAQPIPNGPLLAAFYGGGRRFEFETRPLIVDMTAGACQLEHTLDVRAIDQREHFRVQRAAPLGVRAEWEPADAWRTAQLRNISAGGAALVAGFYYEDGEDLLLQLRPAQYLPPAALVEREDFDERVLGATVLEARRLQDERCLYRVEFRDVSPDDRSYLYRVVQKLQRCNQPDHA
jgi:hypothetical protein